MQAQRFEQIATANVLKRNKMFSYFSGYTKGQVTLSDVKTNSTRGVCYFQFDKPQRATDLKIHDNIQLDGVLACITEINEKSIIACTTIELLANTTLSSAQPGNVVNFGLNAMSEPEENTHYLLEASALGIVKLVSTHLQAGHDHTLQLNFEASATLNDIIEGQHLGLAGSSVTAQNVLHENNHTKFSIFSGRQTRELTQFNEKLAIGTEINLTWPKL